MKGSLIVIDTVVLLVVLSMSVPPVMIATFPAKPSFLLNLTVLPSEEVWQSQMLQRQAIDFASQALGKDWGKTMRSGTL